MNNFQNIQNKLQQFVKKYYTNELIKGLILFFSFGLLYLIFTLLVEYFLWLQPLSRTILFSLFIIVEFSLFIKLIALPIFKLIGLQDGISLKDASQIIGLHFPEVDDKLLNILQLNENVQQSELLIASIEQKSKFLKPIPFKNAVNFSNNKKYLKYLFIPFAIWLLTFFTGNSTIFSDSYERVTHFNTAYEPPAPFKFHIFNENLNVIQGETLKLNIETIGNLIPENAFINFDNSSKYLKNNGLSSFEYVFSTVTSDIEFYFTANKVVSKKYVIHVIPAPIITDFTMDLHYPSYMNKSVETIKNTGNTIIPEGTVINWKIITKNVNSVYFISLDTLTFNQKASDNFYFKKRIYNNLEYQITTSNNELANYESLGFSIEVIKDQFPTINVTSDIDSISHGTVQFAGQLTDDHGLSSLHLIYYDINNKKDIHTHNIPINNSSFEEFYLLFPDGISLTEGVDYEMFFELSDNDILNGYKKVKSKKFSYYKKTKNQVEKLLLEEQKTSIKDIKQTIDNSKHLKEDFQNLQKNLQNKSSMNWNDQKKLKSFLKRQEDYQQLMQSQTQKIQKTLSDKLNIENKSLNDHKKDLQERLKEALELQKQDKLLEELNKLAEKLNKEELTEKLKQLTEKNKQNDKSLERILELTKRFYIEQKTTQLQKDLEKLANKQEELSDKKDNTFDKQKELNSEFNKLKEELDLLKKDNQDLKHPMNLPKLSNEKKEVDSQQEQATDKLEKSDSPNSETNLKAASKNQKSAAKALKKMSQKMQSSLDAMGGGGESMDEDIEALRSILENLLEFSFQEEDLMKSFSSIDTSHPIFSKNLKKQHTLQEYFEHIDDSLYTLAMRQPKISSKIFKDIANVHYHIDEALTHLTDNQYLTGVSDQQFVLTATNNLAFLLSNILNAMQNATPSPGKGKGDKKGNSFSLPDIIQKQEDIMEQMKQGMKQGSKQGDKKGDKQGDSNPQQGQQGESEQMNGQLFEIFKQQSQLRNQLEDLLSKSNTKQGSGLGNKALKQMEELEQEMLQKGLTNDVIEKINLLKHQLLKLKDAQKKQGQKQERQSQTNTQSFDQQHIKQIKFKKLRYNQNEILNRQSLPLRGIYKKKVQDYFKLNDSIK